MKKTSRQLADSLNLDFSTMDLLDQAMTHRSAGPHNNERLEFLGDAVLGQAISDILYHHYRHADEGVLSRLRARLVKRETLSAIAHDLELSQYLHLGAGEKYSGGRLRDSILADALEALIGACYLDQGADAAFNLVERLFRTHIDQLPLVDALKDPKTQLQEIVQSKSWQLPYYEIIKISGKQHDQLFEVSCELKDQGYETRGIGRSRRKAEQDAAKRMLEMLDDG